MNEMKAISKDAHDWFTDKAPSMWSKSHFSTRRFIKNQTKINPPTISKPTFYRGESTSSKPEFYRPKPISFGYDSKVDDVYTRKFCLQPTSTSL
ncbi:hypothetical protein V6N13_133672 [Hibiscus sabdariffa]